MRPFLLAGLFLLLCLSDCPAQEPHQLLVLERMGVMFVGGREVPMADGGRFGGGGNQTQIVDQAPVHFLIPAAEQRMGKTPVVMIPRTGHQRQLTPVDARQQQRPDCRNDPR